MIVRVSAEAARGVALAASLFDVVFTATLAQAQADQAGDTEQQEGLNHLEEAAPDRGQIEEIVVTARRREERLLDVPGSVSVLTAASLERQNIQSGRDLIGKVPNLYFTGGTENNSEMRFTIRGVGSRSPLDASVAVLVDGMFVPTVGFDMDFISVESVEILKGPQGSLFGRNTQGGVINIRTKEPSNDRIEGLARFSYDEFDTVRGDLHVGGPISENIGFTLSGFAWNTDGYIRNETRGEDQLARDSWGVRGKVVFDPTNRLRLTLQSDIQRQEGGFADEGEPLDGQPNETPNHTTITDQKPFEIVENYGFGLMIDYDLDFGVLKSITSVRKINSDSVSDLDTGNTPDRDGMPLLDPFIPNIFDRKKFPKPSGNFMVITRDQRFISEELRLESAADRQWRWIAGLYGFFEENDRAREQRMPDSVFLTNPSNFVSGDVDQDRKGIAVFGEVSYNPLPKLELTVGGRFTHEEDEQDLELEFMAGGGIVQGDFEAMPSETFTDFSPMGSMKYNWADNIMTYVRVAEGFKAGGFNLQGPNNPAANLPFDEETSRMYEFGSKFSLLDNGLSVDAALFWINTDDMQVTTTALLSQGQGEAILTSATRNAAEARQRGFDFSFVARPMPNLQFGGAVGFVDAQFTEFQRTPELDLSGERIEEIPKWMLSFSAEYAFTLSGELDFLLGGFYRYIGNVKTGEGLAEEPFTFVDSFDRLDLFASLQAARWEVTLGVDNVFDSFNVVDKNTSLSFFNTPGQNASQRADPPRRFNFRALYRF